jgi:hypothetical protein
VVLVRGPVWARESVLRWAARRAGHTGTVHVVCEDTCSRRLLSASVLVGLMAGVATSLTSAEIADSAESADFAAVAAILAPFGSRWTWRYVPWGARASAQAQARRIGAVLVLPRRRRSDPVRTFEAER